MVEEARLESVYTPKAYRGFESRSLRISFIRASKCRIYRNKLIIKQLIIKHKQKLKRSLILKKKIEHTMKKLFAILAIFGVLSVGLPMVLSAQEAADQTQTEQVAPAEAEAPVVETPAAAPMEESSNDGGFHQALKVKFIEGGAGFMAAIALTFILGLAFCLERIIYLSLADTNPESFLNKIGDALDRGDVEGAKDMARNTRGPVASIVYQGLLRLNQGPDAVERSIVSYGGVQGGLIERNLSWITLAIAIGPSLGFLGTVIGMVMAFDDIQRAGDMSPTIVAGGMKVALITTVGGLIVAIILQIIYNYILSKVEGLLNRMEDASITFLDQVIKYNVKYKNL